MEPDVFERLRQGKDRLVERTGNNRRVSVLTSPLLAVRFCRAPAQASRVASFLLLPMRFR